MGVFVLHEVIGSPSGSRDWSLLHCSFLHCQLWQCVVFAQESELQTLGVLPDGWTRLMTGPSVPFLQGPNSTHTFTLKQYLSDRTSLIWMGGPGGHLGSHIANVLVTQQGTVICIHWFSMNQPRCIRRLHNHTIGYVTLTVHIVTHCQQKTRRKIGLALNGIAWRYPVRFPAGCFFSTLSVDSQ
jgi:hypothetical protein